MLERCRSQRFIDSDTVSQTTKVYTEVALPRKPRLFLPEQPQHIVIRAHNRDPILVRDDDFRFFYKCLRDAARRNSLAIHAWVFMHNHMHLLATPGNAQSLPKTIQSVGRRYAQYFNRCYHRSGALWEGRYKSSLVETDRYLLSCYQYQRFSLSGIYQAY